MQVIAAYIAGALFGLGLALSGMTQPAKVVGFLDITGAWDPSLAFVMGGALCVFAPAFYLVRKKREKPLITAMFDVPTRTKITWQLIAGASIFGLGWGLSGFCPGTALTSLPTASLEVLVVVAGIVIGIVLMRAVQSMFISNADDIPKADF